MCKTIKCIKYQKKGKIILEDYAHEKCDTISFTRYEYDNNKKYREIF